VCQLGIDDKFHLLNI
jgi:hypothetical protein